MRAHAVDNRQRGGAQLKETGPHARTDDRPTGEHVDGRRSETQSGQARRNDHMRQHQDAPPAPSIRAHAHGPIIAETTIAMEDAPKTRTWASRNCSAIATAKTAGI